MPDPPGLFQTIEKVTPLTDTWAQSGAAHVGEADPPAEVGAGTAIPTVELVVFWIFTLKLLGATGGSIPATKMLTPPMIFVTVSVTVGLLVGFGPPIRPDTMTY